MSSKAIIIVVILLFLATFVPQAQLVLSDVYLGQSSERHDVICNTGNDFPDYSLENVDSFPARSLQAYFALKKLGYQDSEITLMLYHTGDDFVDAYGNNSNDLSKAVIDYENDAVTKDNLRKELMKLASNAGRDSEVVIYIIGHGGYTEGIPVFAFEEGTHVSYDELIGWLEGLKSNRVILLLDFCYSGSFLGGRYPFTGTYITSTSDGNIALFYWNWYNLTNTDTAIFGASGSVFFHPFWNEVAEGKSLREAYDYAKVQLLHWADIDPTIYRDFRAARDVVKRQQPVMYVKEADIIDLAPITGALSMVVTLLIIAVVVLYATVLFNTFRRQAKVQISSCGGASPDPGPSRVGRASVPFPSQGGSCTSR
jgi:hypothetical protein